MVNIVITEGMIETETDNAYGITTIYPDKIELKGKGGRFLLNEQKRLFDTNK